MPNTRRDDDRVRLLTIPDGWPARTVGPPPGGRRQRPTAWMREHRRKKATAIVEVRSDGVAVYAHDETKELRP